MASFTLPRCTSMTSLRLFAPHHCCLKGTQAVFCVGQAFPHRSSGLVSRRLDSVSLVCEAAAFRAPQSKEFYDQALIQLYERETPVVTKLLEEIDKNGLVNEKVEEISGEATSEAEKREVVKAAVDKHWNEMSEAVIMVLAGYAQASYAEGHVEVAETLEMIREEVLAKSLLQLPPEMQALEHLVGMFEQSSEERVSATKDLVAETGRAGISQCDLPALRTTASQMLEDMEEKQGLIDGELLAKLCIVREEIDTAATELSVNQEGTPYFDLMSATWRLLPAGNAAFVKELMHVSDDTKRRALLTACIKDDFQKDPSDTRMEAWVRAGVRPGRLMNTIAAVLANLRKEGVEPDSKEWTRLQGIRATALELLHESIA